MLQVQGDFKIAHCGGFHSFLNLFIKAVNLVAKLLHHNIRWDTETIGCDPRRAPSDARNSAQSLCDVAESFALPDGASRDRSGTADVCQSLNASAARRLHHT